MDLRSTKLIKPRVVTNRGPTRTKCFRSKWRAINIITSSNNRLQFSHSNSNRPYLPGRPHKPRQHSISKKRVSKICSTSITDSRGILLILWWKQWLNSNKMDWFCHLEQSKNKNSSEIQSCSSTRVEITIKLYHQFLVLKKSQNYTAVVARNSSPHLWMPLHPCKNLRHIIRCWISSKTHLKPCSGVQKSYRQEAPSLVITCARRSISPPVPK